jgi:hypothetical protein
MDAKPYPPTYTALDWEFAMTVTGAAKADARNVDALLQSRPVCVPTSVHSKNGRYWNHDNNNLPVEKPAFLWGRF